MRFGYDALASYILMFQKIMLKCLRKVGLFAFSDYATLKKRYGKEIMQRDSVGDGWLISLNYDSSISQVSIENRIHLLIDEAKEICSKK